MTGDNLINRQVRRNDLTPRKGMETGTARVIMNLINRRNDLTPRKGMETA